MMQSDRAQALGLGFRLDRAQTNALRGSTCVSSRGYAAPAGTREFRKAKCGAAAGALILAKRAQQKERLC